MKIYQKIAQTLSALKNCEKLNNSQWFDRHTDTLSAICKEYLPRGSGFDSGTTIDIEGSKPNRIILVSSYHHMNDAGYYDGWTSHKIIITPDLVSGFDLRVTGRDRNEIKEYIEETFRFALNEDPS